MTWKIAVELFFIMSDPMRSPRTYKDAINALNLLQSNFAAIEAIRKLGPSVNKNELSIKEVYEYIRRLGYSPLDFNKLNLIHVTGTKGKGSTCAFTENILNQYRLAAGPITKIGLFTSPHLKTVRERIRINGAPINELKFAKYFFEVWDKLSSSQSLPEQFPTLQPSELVKPMYFKYLTILSFHVFLSEGVDTAIYEVGVGGTYDSTNVIERPTVTAISALGIDHTFMLGTTIESITHNKTGIFKKGVPALVAAQKEHPEALEVVKQRALELGVKLLEIVEEDLLPKSTKLGLLGSFQRQNAALAVRIAATHLEHLGVKASIADDAFLEGLATTKWDGRCQITTSDNYPNITWHIDGAHTMESIAVASTWYADVNKSQKPKTSVLFFNQQSRDNTKDLLTRLYEGTVLQGVTFDHVIFTTNVTWSDGKYNPDLVLMNSSKEEVDALVVQKELAKVWSELDAHHGKSSRKHVFPDIETGANFIKSLDLAVHVFVCGSLHLAGGLLVVLDGHDD